MKATFGFFVFAIFIATFFSACNTKNLSVPQTGRQTDGTVRKEVTSKCQDVYEELSAREDSDVFLVFEIQKGHSVSRALRHAEVSANTRLNRDIQNEVETFSNIYMVNRSINSENSDQEKFEEMGIALANNTLTNSRTVCQQIYEISDKSGIVIYEVGIVRAISEDALQKSLQIAAEKTHEEMKLDFDQEQFRRVYYEYLEQRKSDKQDFMENRTQGSD